MEVISDVLPYYNPRQIRRYGQNTKRIIIKKMRLSKSEINIIKSVACEVWGNQTMIYLFGSRTDDSKKGGDIDLFVDLVAEQEPKKIMLQKAEFLGKLDILLGEQKIDLLVRTHYNNHLPIIKTAQINGVAL